MRYELVMIRLITGVYIEYNMHGSIDFKTSSNNIQYMVQPSGSTQYYGFWKF